MKGNRRIFRGSAGCRRVAVAVCILIRHSADHGIPRAAGAHSPKEVVLSYDQAKQTLEVRITHSVKDPASHYIKKVEIKKNGKASGVTEYKSQPGPETFSYYLPAGCGSRRRHRGHGDVQHLRLKDRKTEAQ